MYHVRCLDLPQMLGHRAAELRKSCRCPMRPSVHSAVVLSARVAKIRRDVDHTRCVTGLFSDSQHRVNQCGRDSVRRGGENRWRRFIAEQRVDLLPGLEGLFRVDAGKMWKGAGHGLAAAAIRHDARQLQVRVIGKQAQQFAGHEAGAAENDSGHARHGYYSAVSACGARAPMPTASMTASPSAAGLLMALIAGTFICCLMMSTPTWLSVDGPVTTHGSM